MQRDAATHPVEQFKQLIAERGVVVLKNVTRLPSYGVTYASENLVIALCHQGYSRAEYDTQLVEFHPHEISIMYPKHTILGLETSEDYNATLVIVSSEFLSTLQHRSTYHYQLEYQKRPAFKLNDEQYEATVSVIDAMEGISKLKTPARDALLADALSLFSQILDEYRFHENGELPEWDKGEKLFYRFYDAITQHFHESHEIKYYANLLCLTPKYFAALIKQETGKSASEWIANYLMIQAKTMLRSRTDLTIQEITERLGFPEQSSFSRYFKQQTGITPREYRISKIN